MLASLRAGIAVLAVGLAVAACGGPDEDPRNAAINPGNNFVITVDHPYQLVSGPGARYADVSTEPLAQRFTSNEGRTSVTKLTVQVARTGPSTVGSRTLRFDLHSLSNGVPGQRLASLGSAGIAEGYEGLLTVDVVGSPVLAASTDYFIVATAGAGDGPTEVMTVVNQPRSNVEPAPEFVSYLDSGGSWLPNETGRNMILTVEVEAAAPAASTTTTAGDAPTTTNPVGGQQTPGSTSSPTSIAGVTGPTTTVAAGTTTGAGTDTTVGTADAGTATVTTVGSAGSGSPGDSTPSTDPGSTVDTTTSNGATTDDTVVTAITAAPVLATNGNTPPEGTAYAPASDPDTTRRISFTLAAFAALSAAGAAAVLGAAGGTPTGQASAGRLSTLADKRLKLRATSRAGAGDRRSRWQRRGTERIDATFSHAPERVAPYSSVWSRILVDGSWARAMFGPLYLLLWPLAVVAGVTWAVDTGDAVGLPAAWLLAAVLVMATLDSLSGALVALAFTVVSAVNGAYGDWSDIRTLLGIWVVLLSPALIGNVVRPLRRVVHDSPVALRERFLDYVMGPVGTMFAVSALVEVLNGLSGAVIAGDGDVTVTRWAVWAAMVARLALEDRAVHSYPERLRAVQPEQVPAQSATWAVIGAASRFAMYLFVSAPFFGAGTATVVSALLLTVPFAIKPWEKSVPNSAQVSRWLPRGFLRFAILVLVGGWLAAALLGDSPTADTVRSVTPWLFVPSAVFSLLDQFAGLAAPWPDTRTKRWGGAVLWVVVVLVLSGSIDPF